MRSLVIVLMMVFVAYLPARADYVAPRVAESYWVLAAPGEWELRGMNLHLKRAGTSFPIESFWLCHYVNSNMICTGQTESFTRDHLAAVKRGEGKRWLEVEVILPTLPRSERRLAGKVMLFDFPQAYKRAQEFGSPLLGLEKEAVAKIAAPDYQHRVKLRSEADWKRLIKARPRPASSGATK